MTRSLVRFNWIAVAVTVLSLALLYLLNSPKARLDGLLIVMPFVAALITFHFEPGRWFVLAAAMLNAGYAAGGVVDIFDAFFSPNSGLLLVLFQVAAYLAFLVIPTCLNTRVLLTQWRMVSASHAV